MEFKAISPTVAISDSGWTVSAIGRDEVHVETPMGFGVTVYCEKMASESRARAFWLDQEEWWQQLNDEHRYSILGAIIDAKCHLFPTTDWLYIHV